MSTARDALPFRDQVAILAHVARTLWLIAIDLRDRPQDVSEEEIQQLVTNIWQLEALQGGGR